MKNRNKNDKLVTILRAKMGAERITQKDLSRRTGIKWEYLNGFLCRRIDLVEGDIDKILDELELKELLNKLSAPADVDI